MVGGQYTSGPRGAPVPVPTPGTRYSMPVRPLQRRAVARSPSVRRAACRRAALACAALALASCGNKGDLYLSGPAADASGSGTPERELDGGAVPTAERPTRSPAFVPEAELDGAAADIDGPGPRTGRADAGDGAEEGKDGDARRRRGTSP